MSAIGPLRELAEQSVMWLEPGLRGRMLDVGCGAGVLLRRMRERGWEVHGIETDPEAASVARRSLGAETIHIGTLDDAPYASGTFDVITLFHVIEHVHDPRDSLVRCYELLRPGGRLVLVTPNAMSAGARRFGSNWLHWDPPRHLQVFSPANLPNWVSEAGFRLKRVFTPSTSAYPIWQAGALLRARGRLSGVDTSSANPLQKLAGIVFWAWEYMRTRQGRLLGEDLVIVAERPNEPGESRTTQP